MKNIMVQCLLCGSMAIGLWTLLLAYFHYNQENRQLKKTQELTRTRPLGENVYRQNHDSEETPKQNIINGKSDTDEPGKTELYPRTNCDLFLLTTSNISQIQYLEE